MIKLMRTLRISTFYNLRSLKIWGTFVDLYCIFHSVLDCLCATVYRIHLRKENIEEMLSPMPLLSCVQRTSRPSPFMHFGEISISAA